MNYLDWNISAKEVNIKQRKNMYHEYKIINNVEGKKIYPKYHFSI